METCTDENTINDPPCMTVANKDICICAGADPGFVNRGFVINARQARGKFLGGHACF